MPKLDQLSESSDWAGKRLSPGIFTDQSLPSHQPGALTPSHSGSWRRPAVTGSVRAGLVEMAGPPCMVSASVHFTLDFVAPVPEQGREVRSSHACLHIDPDAACFYLTKQFSNRNLYCSAQSPS